MDFPLGVLSRDKVETDYTLHPDATSCWIIVGNASVHIRNAGSHLGVDVYPRFRESADPASTIWLRQPKPATDREVGLGASMPDGDMEGSAFGDHMREPM